MLKRLLILILLSANVFVMAQEMKISGTVIDTTSKVPLRYSTAMAIRIKDSVLLKYARTDENGRFDLITFIDTVQVIISNPRFGDQYYYVFGSASNNIFDFGKIVLPPKMQQLNEVVIYAYKDPVYYKGDTLIYTADSFKVKPNATVEDLLKKLPGIKVDAKGKITSQGKEISQVLVDGDEFFGTDPTVATKNLAAKGVESVQVYEKKDENATEGNETVQVMNLKLKDEAKKGYFGKASAASDFQNFHEGELLANKFNKQQKISVFALGSNTPRSSLGWQDMYKYGLDNEMNSFSNDDGNTYWYSNNNGNNGIPRTLKSGIYYTDKLNKNTKINFNYTYGENTLKTKSTTRSQYFLSDTSYVTDNLAENKQSSSSHAFNFGIVQTIDSLTELEIRPKLVLNTNKTENFTVNDFLTSNDTLTRKTEILNQNKANGYDANVFSKLTHRFKKKDRLLQINYSYNNKNDIADGFLKSNNIYYSSSLIPNDTINQKKENTSKKEVHNTRITYTEPLTKKIKIEFEYILNYNLNSQNKKTSNYFNGEYSVNDSLFSNNFGNLQFFNRAGFKFLYESKKTRFAIGARAQQNELNNHNLINNTKVKFTGTAILPYLTYQYRFSDNTRYNFAYYTSTNQPSVNQLQPVPDNTNPNRIVVGNPNLKPTYNNRFEMWFNSWKPITGRSIWASANFNINNNSFANSTTFDSIGRTVSKTVNVNDNYSGNAYIGIDLPFFSKLLQLEPNINGSYNRYSNIVNSKTNITETKSLTSELSIVVEADTIEFEIRGNYSLNYTQSSLSQASNKPYSSQQYYAGIRFKLPFKFLLESEVEYNLNSQRTNGYNINYVLWNGALRKTFFKNENFVVAFEANDILNQNISTNRDIQDNVITDTKTNIISRYLLLRLIYKFNSNRTKENDEFDW